MRKRFLDEINNIRSLDLHAADAVATYLRGYLTKSKLKKLLQQRAKDVKKETKRILEGIEKLQNILDNCPDQISVMR